MVSPPPPVGRSDHTDNVIKAVFGREVVNYTYQECEAAGALPSTCSSTTLKATSNLRKAHLATRSSPTNARFYWRNELRNVCIAALATVIPKDPLSWWSPWTT